MEMQNYYFPKMEEFHIGFLYEEKLKNPNWHKMIRPPKDVYEFVEREYNTSHSLSKMFGKIRCGGI